MLESLRRYLVEQEAEMIALLERLVRINSYSANKPGVDRVADVLEAQMRAMGFMTRRDAQPVSGDNLVAENATRNAHGGGALLVGHMDTVFPPEMGFDAFTREGNNLHGPGTYDMKGGLVAGIFALKALDAAGLLQDKPVAFVFNSDEEIGSPHSRELIMQEARNSAFCFVMEGCGQDFEVVTGRKGRIVFNLKVEGKAGHAGHSAYSKASAVLELSRQIVALEALNDSEAGTSLNAGFVEGGVGPNTIAAFALARLETRFVNARMQEQVWSAIKAIAAAPQTEGTRCRLDIVTSRPPMVTDESILGLYELVAETAAELGIQVKSAFRGGGSDANTVAQTGIPVIDGMGPIGAQLHTPGEHLFADTMVERTFLTAACILKGLQKYN